MDRSITQAVPSTTIIIFLKTFSWIATGSSSIAHNFQMFKSQVHVEIFVFRAEKMQNWTPKNKPGEQNVYFEKIQDCEASK